MFDEDLTFQTKGRAAIKSYKGLFLISRRDYTVCENLLLLKLFENS